MLLVIWYSVFGDSVYIFTEALMSFQLDSSKKIKSPSSICSIQDIRKEIKKLYPTCGKR